MPTKPAVVEKMVGRRHPGGRPPLKYSEKQSIQICKDLLEWLDGKDNWFVNKFMVENKIAHSTFAKFVDRFPACKELYELAKDKQEVKMAEAGMNPDCAKNMIFRIFAMKNLCNWKDKNEESFTGELSINSFIQRPAVSKKNAEVPLLEQK